MCASLQCAGVWLLHGLETHSAQACCRPCRSPSNFSLVMEWWSGEQGCHNQHSMVQAC